MVMQKLRALQLLLHEGRTIFFLDTVLTAQQVHVHVHVHVS